MVLPGQGHLKDLFLPPWDIELLSIAHDNCRLTGFDVTYDRESVFTAAALEATGNDDLAGFEPWRCMLRENSLVHTSVPRASDVPALVLIAGADELISEATEHAAFETLCSRGYRLQHLVCDGASHVEGFLHGLNRIVGFVQARFEGEPMPDHTCVLQSPTDCQADSP